MTTISINQSFYQSLQKLHWKAHYIGQAAFNFLDEFVARFFNGISTSLILPGVAFYMLSDLLISQTFWVNGRDVTFT